MMVPELCDSSHDSWIRGATPPAWKSLSKMSTSKVRVSRMSHSCPASLQDTLHDHQKFLKMCTGTSMHWIGLSRALGESWRWTDGATFNAWFEISGNGLFAFLNTDGVSSSRGLVDIKWICSKPRF
ncbi:C-type lectin domain family 2 member A [Vicugna pacos]|uniref:C-type lectin domain family 2 member A n=1 Tax=Vicugna pacos TaxID=30538 RepID=A0ABM5CPE1_VICPA